MLYSAGFDCQLSDYSGLLYIHIPSNGKPANVIVNPKLKYVSNYAAAF